MRPAEHRIEPDNKYTEELWGRVCLNDTASLEAIHKILYPVLFKYVCAILRDMDVADEIIAEAFIRCWQQRNEITRQRIVIELVKGVRQAATFYLTELTIDCRNGAADNSSANFAPAILLSAYNSLNFRREEIDYLGEYLQLDCIAISEILGC
jgi:DNA-directed RNA polymerase specialized sigma24 family protein